MKIIIPIETFEGEASQIFPHFGRAPIFALANLTQDHKIEDIKPIKNVGENFGGHGAAEALVLEQKVDAIVVKGMGPRGLQAFQEKSVAVFTGDVNTVGEAIDAYINGKLTELTEPCRDARHR